MSIHFDSQHTQEDARSSIAKQETIAQPMRPPSQPPPPPPRFPQGRREHWFLVSVLMVVLVIVLALGTFFAVQLAGHPATQPVSTPGTGINLTRVPTAATTPKPVTPTTAPTGAATPTPTQASAPSQPLSAIWMSNATTGWASTPTHQVLHTSDGGQSWQNVTPPPPYPGSSRQVPPAFTSLNGIMAWVTSSGQGQQAVFRTSDGGTTWQETTLPANILGVSQVQFFNTQDGWILAGFGGSAMGSQAVDLLRTTDGGQTWSLITKPGSTFSPIPIAGQKTGMSWSSPTTGWVTGTIAAATNTVLLYRTQDGGVSWQAQTLPLPSMQAIITTQPPVFFDSTHGLLPVIFNTPPRSFKFAIYATNDGGATWHGSTLLSIPTNSSVWSFFNMQQGWVLGANGTTLDETNDAGQHWTAITPSANFRHISELDFVSAQAGWAISTATPNAPVLLKTTDGGQTWMAVPVSLSPQGVSWHAVTSPNVGTSNNTLNSLAAFSASNIWAVGVSQNVDGPYQTLIERWNGTSWQAVASPSPGTSISWLSSVAAADATNIWAVGYYQNGAGLVQTLIERWNGTSWRVVPSPSPGTGSNGLYGVAALSATNIWAVGFYHNKGGSGQTLIEHWNGTSWQVVASPNMRTGVNVLNSITALSATNIWAVGSYQNSINRSQSLIEHWNGTSWQIVASPDVGTVSNQLSSVAALSASNIWAVGAYGAASQSPTRTLIEHWNGTSWQVIASPSPGTSLNRLSSVVALSASNIWTVGFYQIGTSPYLTLIEHWNGTRWQMVASPSPGTGNDLLSGPGNNWLYGVAADNASNIWTVGFYENGGRPPSQTLIEKYS